ncbi:124_t:CDS:10 [Diversispora eburnea]|uniref:T-complex protein 1 subunit delta n=1 Tax=Diversispora eburnea TaxID=1213867 RepID=A0A9N9AIA7_9GLOM|nr:124_t:CDS:10 [Diversispora eburnea]
MVETSNNFRRSFNDKEKPVEVRQSNIVAAKGMDKMIQTANGEVVITNDGATILKHMSVLHPAAKMLVDLSAAQDVEAGDGTTSVVVIAGALLSAAEKMLSKGIHPTTIAEAFQRAASKSTEFLTEILLAPIAVDAVLHVIDPSTATNVDLKDVRIVKKVGGTIDDTELVDGLVLTQNVVKTSGGPSRIEKAKIGLIQFQLSPPKPDKIKKTGCNVLLIQKSILRDAVNDLSLHFLSKLKILVIKDIERDEIEFICKSTGCKPTADIDSFTEDKLGYAELIDEVQTAGVRIVKITGVKHNGKTVSILIRGANSLILEEAERSLHDALCVVLSQRLSEHAKSLKGMEAYCFEAFANALEVIPVTLAENAGLNPINIVTDLRNRHARGEKTAGINVRKGTITNILEENVIQPLLVSSSAIELAAETVKMLLKIDDLVSIR